MAENLITEKPQFTIGVPSLDGGANCSIEVYDKQSEQFAARLRKVFKERRKWAAKEGVSCYRIYDADLPDYAVAIDLYQCTGSLADPFRNFAEEGESFLYIAEYKAPKNIDENKASRRFADVCAIAPAVCGVLPEDVFAKVRQQAKGGSQYAENDESFTFASSEYGLSFEIDLGAYLDTGLILDHRMTRRMVGQLCKGKTFLNLFAYTGSCSVYAAAGGAFTTTTVDLSQTYLDWAQRNMQLNGFEGGNHSFERGDTMAWLREASKKGRKFDVVFVDPPTFSNSKAMRGTWDVQRDHVGLLRLVNGVLAEDGVVVFSCNLRSFKIDAEALESLGLVVEDISAKTIPADFQRNGKIHQCFWLKRSK